MRLALQDLPDYPVIPSAAVRELRARLILEEALETVMGLGFETEVISRQVILSPTAAGPNLVEIVDGCLDVKVVTTGTLSACGVPDDELQRMVDLNNLAKFGPGGHRREDGKWIKPPDHKPPAIGEFLQKQSPIGPVVGNMAGIDRIDIKP